MTIKIKFTTFSLTLITIKITITNQSHSQNQSKLQSNLNQAQVEGRREDCMTFSGLARDWDTMAVLLLHKLAENLDPQAEKRSFWKVW